MQHAFVYLRLDIPPADIDVNVHPTKREVKFLNEAAIIDHIQECLDALLQGAKLSYLRCFVPCTILTRNMRVTGGNESRTFYTQMLLTGVDAAAVRQSQQEQAASAEGEGSETRERGAKQLVLMLLHLRTP